MKKALILVGVFSILAMSNCQKPCYCGDAEAEVPYYPLPDELKAFFTLPGDSIVYTFKDSISGETEIIRLSYTEIAGSASGACGPQCMSVLSRKCDCRSLRFKPDSLFGETYIRITPSDDYTRINFMYRPVPYSLISSGDIYYHEKDSLLANRLTLNFQKNVLINGGLYEEVLLIREEAKKGNHLWFGKDIGLIKFKASSYGTKYNFELDNFEVHN